MADSTRTGFDVPAQMREGAEKSLEQARKALDTYIGAARRAAETMEQSADTTRARSREMAERTLSSAEENIHAALDLAERLLRAKSPQEAVQIQTEFVRAQVESMQAQMRELGTNMQSALGQMGRGGAGNEETNAATGAKSRTPRK